MTNAPSLIALLICFLLYQQIAFSRASLTQTVTLTNENLDARNGSQDVVSEITMDAVGEAYVRLEQQMMDTEAMLAGLLRNLWIDWSDTYHLAACKEAATEADIADIYSVLKMCIKMQSGFPKHLKPARDYFKYFYKSIVAKDLIAKERPAVVRALTEERLRLESELERISGRLRSSGMAALESYKKDTEIQLKILRYFVARNNGDAHASKSKCKAQIAAITRSAYKTLKSLTNKDGVVELIKKDVGGLKARLDDFGKTLAKTTAAMTAKTEATPHVEFNRNCSEVLSQQRSPFGFMRRKALSIL